MFLDKKLHASYATKLPEVFYSKVEPNPVSEPKLIKWNQSLAEQLGIEQEGILQALAGNSFPEASKPIAQAYAGHQFGNFTMLGDGRATLIGEWQNNAGEKLDIQLKGSGRTPYSRGGDGRAALGPMLREYIISEAMHGLGIPTTRSLAVVSTGDPVYRETALPGAVLTRLAKSHIRVGTFEYARRFCSETDLLSLADYSIERHYPELVEKSDRYLRFFQAVVDRQASLLAQWVSVGFIHGVMNTDNMTISGETIDYGPCAFLDEYDPKTVFSSIDVQGRYAYANQPPIAAWNLARFAETLLPLMDDVPEEAVKKAEAILKEYPSIYRKYWLDIMYRKLGIQEAAASDEALVEDLLKWMEQTGADYTNTFRALTIDDLATIQQDEDFLSWKKRWDKRTSAVHTETVRQTMKQANPNIIPRNHLVEEALDAAGNGDYTLFDSLLEAVSDPYNYTPSDPKYTANPPEPDEPFQTFCGT
ncbi:YdiU family protein [Terribacillus sp. DMT04]|uniref:protein adenylyltransferase SelO n=1 Tax=Terribacillus sp. DMT04 TaxID=2850441 RepID=UPI001C2C6F1B|nr:YdiU family protein [Terribacillus sp. DMT04]QXE03213.1 YdiU family protein [Terribacillus sp. DMT04]